MPLKDSPGFCIRYYDSYLPTYFGGVAYWYNADGLDLCKPIPEYRNIHLIEANSPGGSLNFDGVVTVLDPSGTLVPNLDLLLETASGDLVQARTTDADGYFIFENLAPGNYQLMTDYINSQVYNFYPPQVPLNTNLTEEVFLFPDRLVIDGLTSIDSEVLKENVRIFPNPSADRIWIRFENRVEALQFVVFDTLGKLVKTTDSYSGDLIEIEVADLAEGVYFVGIKNEGETLMLGRLSVQRGG